MSLESDLRKAGGAEFLPEASGPYLDVFEPMVLAEAILHELDRARSFGWPRISLHMSLDDAFALAKFLKGRR